MNIEIYKPEYCDLHYDDCIKEPEVILEINCIKIPLCHNCLKTLKDKITEYEFSKF